MFLKRVDIENFRGIRQATLDLLKTTVLIGENDSGKSAIVDALALCLGVDAPPEAFRFAPHDFHRPVDSADDFVPAPLRICLTFGEREPGEWNAPVYRTLTQLLPEAQSGPREFVLEVVAEIAAEEAAVDVGWWLRDTRGTRIGNTNNAQLIAWLRRLTPLIVIRGGLLVSSRPALPAGARENVPDSETQHLVALVDDYYQRVLASASAVSEQELHAGYEAAQEFVARRGARHLEPREARSRWILEELTEAAPKPAATSSARELRMRGTGAHKIALFLLVGALLEARGSELDSDAEPLVAIENPEAHLHPLTLASVWDLIDGIKWQKIISTHSGTLLTAVPLRSIRRLVRRKGIVRAWQIEQQALSREDRRRVGYHIRARRGTAFFARCWLLVEGETEFWLLPELARLCGYDFAVEGVVCVEFAQSGIAPLVKFADALGIEWHLLADGDRAGQSYAASAQSFLNGRDRKQRITQLRELDVEHCLWRNGYAELYRRVAGAPARRRRDARQPRHEKPGRIIERAIRKTSKPYMALAALEAVSETGSAGVPRPLRAVIERVIGLARGVV